VAENAQLIPGSHAPLQDGFDTGFPPQGCGGVMVVVVLDVVVGVVVVVVAQPAAPQASQQLV
jgi:hypothetical protein